MKRLVFAVIFGFICTQLAGCSGWTMRTSSSRKARVDQKIAGNRGFIFGQPTSSPKEPAFKDRKVYEVEIEIPEFPRKKEEKKKPEPLKKKSTISPSSKEDRAGWGNRGYILGGPERKATLQPKKVEAAPVARIKEKVSQILKAKPEEKATLRTYQVQKNDTLQKISQKFYGTTRKWTMLYKANRDKLKSPDSIYHGQVLVIPEAGEYKK